MRIQLPFALLAAVVFTCALHAAPAQAQRVFVSATGSDGNPCTFAFPCRTFQHAHDTVVAGGEIDVLDPAGYGSLVISKSINIQGHGFSGISAPSSAKAIVIAASASDVVVLQGLVIEGGGAALDGVTSQSVGSLIVEDSEIRGFTGTAIFVTGSSGTHLFVSNTRVMNSQNGVYVWPSGPSATGTLTRVEAINNTNGITARSTDVASGGYVDLQVRDCVVLQYIGPGILAWAPSGTQTAIITILNTMIENYAPNNLGFGIHSLGGKVNVSRSTIAAINSVVQENGGFVASYGDNIRSGLGGFGGLSTYE